MVLSAYKGYHAIIQWDESSQLYRGRVLETDGMMNFRGRNAEEVNVGFFTAVNDWLHMCELMKEVRIMLGC